MADIPVFHLDYSRLGTRKFEIDQPKKSFEMITLVLKK